MRCALVEIGRHLLTLGLTFPFLVTWLAMGGIGLTLVLMIAGIPEEFELVEDKIRYCASN